MECREERARFTLNGFCEEVSARGSLNLRSPCTQINNVNILPVKPHPRSVLLKLAQLRSVSLKSASTGLWPSQISAFISWSIGFISLAPNQAPQENGPVHWNLIQFKFRPPGLSHQGPASVKMHRVSAANRHALFIHIRCTFVWALTAKWQHTLPLKSNAPLLSAIIMAHRSMKHQLKLISLLGENPLSVRGRISSHSSNQSATSFLA